MKHFIICLLFVVSSTISPNSMLAQVKEKTPVKKLSFHLAGSYFQLGSYFKIDHAQVGIAYAITPKIGIGVGGGRWLHKADYHKNRYSFLGVHGYMVNQRWLARLEVGGLSELTLNNIGTLHDENYHLRYPLRSLVFRLQGGIRFLKYGLAGISGSWIPGAQLTGQNIHYFSNQAPEITSIQKTFRSFGLQGFVGIWLFHVAP